MNRKAKLLMFNANIKTMKALFVICMVAVFIWTVVNVFISVSLAERERKFKQDCEALHKAERELVTKESQLKAREYYVKSQEEKEKKVVRKTINVSTK